MRNVVRGKWVGMRFSASCLVAIVLGAPLGCGTDDQFSAETDDEYTAPLTNALVGTPNGVTSISADGQSTSVPVGPVVSAPGPGAGGSAGSASGGAGPVGSAGS